MPGLPGDQNITRLFGFPGFEALIRVGLKYINQARAAHNQSALSYGDFLAEIETEMQDIFNGSP